MIRQVVEKLFWQKDAGGGRRQYAAYRLDGRRYGRLQSTPVSRNKKIFLLDGGTVVDVPSDWVAQDFTKAALEQKKISEILAKRPIETQKAENTGEKH